MADYIPPVGFHFRVRIGNLPADSNDARFQEISGLTLEIGVEELAEGGENRFAHRLPSRGKFANLVLKRGLFKDSTLISWCKNAIENFDFEPTTVDVELLNEEHEPVGFKHSFVNAYPVKWSISDHKATDNSIVIETLELAYQYFTRSKV